MSEAADQVLVSLNVDPGFFQLLAALAEGTAWLAQGEEWRKQKAIDVVFAMSDFFATVENATESAPQLAEHFGTTFERADFVLSFLGGMGLPFPDAIEQMKQILPAVGVYENNSSLFIGIFVLLFVLALGFVSLRLYSRKVTGGFIRAYDWVIVFALILSFVFGIVNAICLAGPTHLRGRWLRSWEEYRVEVWSGKFTEVMYPTSVLMVKSSLLLFYWGLTTWWPLRTGVVVVFLICLANTLGMMLSAMLRCNPFVAYEGTEWWTATCDMDKYAKGEEITGAVNIATDIVIWLMPLPMVWKITQGMRERLLACFTFGLGALACIACGMRFSYFSQLNTPAIIPRDQSRWLLWAMVEMFLAIICSCVPAIRALVIKRAPSFIGSAGLSDSTYDKDDKSTDKEKTMVNVDSDSV